MNRHQNLLTGILMVAGTSIGGGMLALPVLTSLGGFVPSLLIYFICWAFMASTGLLFLEITGWMKKDANIVSMAEKTLGPWGKASAWGLYLFLFYCLNLAYIVGCGDLFYEVGNGAIPEWTGPVLFVLLFAPFIYAGTHVSSRMIVFLMIGLGICYAGFVVMGLPQVNMELLAHRNWSLSLLALPISFTAFAYQGIIPTLLNYMDHDVAKTRRAILIGSFLPLILYVIWQGLILGIIPVEGPGGLEEALKNGDNAVTPLKNFIESRWVYVFGQFFAFFALVTSFFGVTLGLKDFLADGLSIKKDAKGKAALCLLIFIPPLAIAYVYPHVFLKALDLAGGFGCALLLGLLPILMVWSGRYHLKLPSFFSFPGGKATLLLMILFVIFELGCELAFAFTR